MLVNLEVMKVNPKDLIKYLDGIFTEEFLQNIFKDYWRICIESTKEFFFIVDKDNKRVMLNRSNDNIADIYNNEDNDFYCFTDKQSLDEFRKEIRKLYSNDRVYRRQIKIFEHKDGDLFLYQVIEDTNYKDIIFPDIEEIYKHNLIFTIFKVDKKTKICHMIQP